MSPIGLKEESLVASEIEQLRKEVNELRERIAVLEARPVEPAIPFLPSTHYYSPTSFGTIT